MPFLYRSSSRASRAVYHTFAVSGHPAHIVSVDLASAADVDSNDGRDDAKGPTMSLLHATRVNTERVLHPLDTGTPSTGPVDSYRRYQRRRWPAPTGSRRKNGHRAASTNLCHVVPAVVSPHDGQFGQGLVTTSQT